MSRARLAAVALGVAAALALTAGVVPSVAGTVRTHQALRADGGALAAPLDLRRSDGPVARLHTGALVVPDLGGGEHRVRVGVAEPTGEPVADLLFLHGHADRLDNHAALFDALTAAGVRVVSFDLPSHGGTDAGAIDRWSFDDLAAVTGRVLRATQQDAARPLMVTGWSFGGLLATRFVQDPAERSALGRPVRALVLESPAVAPRAFAGGDGSPGSGAHARPARAGRRPAGPRVAVPRPGVRGPARRPGRDRRGDAAAGRTADARAARG